MRVDKWREDAQLSEDSGESDDPERPEAEGRANDAEPSRDDGRSDDAEPSRDDGQADDAAPSRDGGRADDAEPSRGDSQADDVEPSHGGPASDAGRTAEDWFRRGSPLLERSREFGGGREPQDGSGLRGAPTGQPDRVGHGPDRGGHGERSGEDLLLAHAHDPNEVTVQLDAIGYDEGRLTVQEKQRGHEVPVFVDDSGRRSRTLRRIGIAVGTVCAVYAVVIVATLLSGNSSAPWLPITGQKDDGKPASQVEPSPLPADTASPSDSAGTAPDVLPSGTDGITASPGDSASASPDPSASASKPGESADPDPTTSNEPDPQDTTSDDPGPGPDPTGGGPTTDPVDPEPTDTGEPSTEPTPSSGEDDGTDTVAESPIGEAPVELDPGSPAEPSASSPSSSESTL
ncbi:hypothetical protein [Streptomyces jeddahensis]|uniref:Uncharacterized protein n=1 Tax=Streptomyces jeddahensis TaxID=1716141 RepID=A0A177HWV1_9ACTN|nr:hypothetical protein [Streptomyces jeddahensis]OAH15099.1 hypothetical protein STSP_14770 [Streptomyces jeddahensis]